MTHRPQYACRACEQAVVQAPAPERLAFTRVVEHKHFDLTRTPLRNFTVVTYEYPFEWQIGMDAFYPIGTKPNLDRLKLYQERAMRACPQVHFGGRRGSYR